MGEPLFYAPNLCKPAFVEIDGKKVYASNDSERTDGAPAPEKWFDVTAPQVFVVRSLPVPLHVSDGPVDRRAGWSSGGEPRHEAEYGAPYNSHPYWRSSVGIAPLFAGPTVGFVGTPRAKVFGMTPAQARAAITALILALLWQLLR